MSIRSRTDDLGIDKAEQEVIPMNMKWLAILGLVFLTGAVFAEEPTLLKTQKDRENYGTGVSIARNIKQQGGEVNLNVLIQGMMDELKGDHLLMTEEALRNTIAVIQNDQMLKQKQSTINRDEKKVETTGTTKTVNATPKDDAGLQQQQERPENTIEQVDQSGLLAGTTKESPGENAVGQLRMGRGQRSDQGNQLTPDGKVMSWRNQAKLGVQAMKAERRAAAASSSSEN